MLTRKSCQQGNWSPLEIAREVNFSKSLFYFDVLVVMTNAKYSINDLMSLGSIISRDYCKDTIIFKCSDLLHRPEK